MLVLLKLAAPCISFKIEWVEGMKRQSEIIKEIKDDSVPLSFGFIFVNWRFLHVSSNKNMFRYSN